MEGGVTKKKDYGGESSSVARAQARRITQAKDQMARWGPGSDVLFDRDSTRLSAAKALKIINEAMRDECGRSDIVTGWSGKVGG